MSPLALEIDGFLKRILCNAAGFDIFEVPPVGTPCVTITSERIVVLKCKNGGLGFRPYEQRYLLLNSLNNTMPQATDRIDEIGNSLPGLWNSLASILGQGSFDRSNRAPCWSHFHGSGSSFGSDHFSLIELVKGRYACCHSALNVYVPEQENIFSAPTLVSVSVSRSYTKP
jgi:hypothetical protein